jgi:hypothetical protein
MSPSAARLPPPPKAPGAPPAAGGGKRRVNPNEARSAASVLGNTYLMLAQMNALPLGKWALPGQRFLQGPLLNAMYAAYPWRVRAGTAGYISTEDMHRAYDNAHRITVDAVQQRAHSWLFATMAGEIGRLSDLEKALKVPAIADQIHLAATCARQYEPTLPPDPKGLGIVKGEGAAPAARRVARESLGRAIAVENHPLLRLLYNHPDGVNIISAYHESAKDGTAVAVNAVRSSITASSEILPTIAAEPTRVWRYPPAIVAGVSLLGLQDVPGFAEYCVALCHLLGKDWLEDKLDVVSNVLAIIAFLGPIGRLVAAIGDLIVVGARGAIDYLKMREQGLVAETFAFADPSSRLGQWMTTADTLGLLGAVAFQTGLALIELRGALGEVKALRASVRGGPKLTDHKAVDFTDPIKPRPPPKSPPSRPRVNTDPLSPAARATTSGKPSAGERMTIGKGTENIGTTVKGTSGSGVLEKGTSDFGRALPIEGATEVRVAQAEFEAALGHVFPAQSLDQVTRAIDGIGNAAAQGAVANPQFVAAVQSGNWPLAGTLFHSAAAKEARVLPPSALPAGWRIQAEHTIQAGVGGSRVDILLSGPTGQLIEFDWKTTGRSALSSKARQEMARHAGQISTNIGGALSTQESRSWIDFVRPLLPGVKWP